MTEFVRICPRCGHTNPEYENLCAKCQQFIGMEPSVPRTAEKEVPMPTEDVAASVPAHADIKTATITETPETTPPAFYLTLGDSIFTIHDGAVIGQQHASNRSAVQIPPDIEGCRYVHRQHCSFHFQDGEWYVQAIDQQMFGQSFTNPVWLNEQQLSVATHHRLQHGDILRLSAIALTVDIQEKSNGTT